MEKEKKEWIVKIGEKGEVQLPQGAQDCLGIKTGDTVEFKVEGLNDDVVVLQKA